MPQVRKFLSEHLFEGSIRGKQAVAHEDRLLTTLNDVSIEAPVIVCLVLLAASGRGKNEQK